MVARDGDGRPVDVLRHFTVAGSPGATGGRVPPLAIMPRLSVVATVPPTPTALLTSRPRPSHSARPATCHTYGILLPASQCPAPRDPCASSIDQCCTRNGWSGLWAVIVAHGAAVLSLPADALFVCGPRYSLARAAGAGGGLRRLSLGYVATDATVLMLLVVALALRSLEM